MAIPARATGSFNPNALYETNIAQAGGIKVVKGPGSALYGSDAIGGIVNILSRVPFTQPAVSATGALGAFGGQRLLLDGTLRISANLAHADGCAPGWLDAVGYRPSRLRRTCSRCSRVSATAVARSRSRRAATRARCSRW